MATFEWNDDKNDQLVRTRGVSFREVVEAYDNGSTLSIEKNPSPKYDNQYLLIVEIRNYAYIIPFVVTDHNTVFLKTIYPSRKQNKKFINLPKEQ